MGGERNDGESIRGIALQGANLSCRFEPVHFRHLHIHEHHIDIFGLGKLQCFAAIVCDKYFVSLTFENSQHELLISIGVFGNEYRPCRGD